MASAQVPWITHVIAHMGLGDATMATRLCLTNHVSGNVTHRFDCVDAVLGFSA